MFGPGCGLPTPEAARRQSGTENIRSGVASGVASGPPGDVIYLEQNLSFEAPVRPGDMLRADVEVVEAVGGDRVRVETTASVGEETVIDGEATVLSVPHDG